MNSMACRVILTCAKAARSRLSMATSGNIVGHHSFLVNHINYRTDSIARRWNATKASSLGNEPPRIIPKYKITFTCKAYLITTLEIFR